MWGWGGRRRKTSHGRRGWRRGGNSSPSVIIHSISALFSRLGLRCVGEFTVSCNLIPNKVSQQILLSQKDAAEHPTTPTPPASFQNPPPLRFSIYPPENKRQLRQETLRRLFPSARFSSPSCVNYLELFSSSTFSADPRSSSSSYLPPSLTSQPPPQPRS